MRSRKLQQTVGIFLSLTVLFSALGVAPTLAATPDGPSSGETLAYAAYQVYVVQRGDTLSGLASRFNTSVQAIMQANALRSTTIYVGQRLLIPDAVPQPGTVYVVQRGDTLSAIARRFGTTVQAIMQANGLTSTRIYAGQRLSIPGGNPRPGPGTVYIVQRGDTLSAIAYRYRTTVQAIMAANNLRSTTIYVGQRLVIPGSNPDDPRPGPGTVYIVQRGDTLSAIARRFGTTVQAIMTANNLRSTTIYVGQRLVIRSANPGRQSKVTISPSSGPPGTVVQVVASGFPAYALVSVAYGPLYSEYTEVARGKADGNGVYIAHVRVQGEPGMGWLFAAATDGEQAVSVPFYITN